MESVRLDNEGWPLDDIPYTSNPTSPTKSILKNSTSKTSSVTVFCEESVDGVVDPNMSIRSAVSLSEDVQVIECSEHPPSPEQSCPEISSEHAMTFQNVSYSVRGFNKCHWTTKTILTNVSGVMVPGINAIMGPTGGGKTTLLDVLAKRKGTSGLSQTITGSVLLNGEHLPSDFNLRTGYVVQEDILEGILTVRENLQFSAALRLPRDITNRERSQRVQHIIQQLGLITCADSTIGTEFIRGVSGGERRRTVIGMELIIDPVVLFMDEPTTGLDAHTAVSVVQTLQDWCMEDNRLVILSIHQPRYSIFKLFDSLTLLSLGSVIYQGKASHVVKYFGRLGYGLEEMENPADFLLDILNDSQSAISLHRRTVRKHKPKETLDLIQEFQKSEESQLIEKCLEHANTESEPSARKRCSDSLHLSCRKMPSTIATFLWQILVLAVRSTIANFRNPSTLLFQTCVMIAMGFVVGVVYYQIDDRMFTILNSFVSDRLGALFFIILIQEFGVLSGFELFISARPLFIHENGGGFYRVSSYFISKIVTDIIPLRLIPVVLFSVISYFMMGFQLSAGKFFIYLLMLSLGVVALSSLAFLISAAIKNHSIAIVTFTLTHFIMLLFSGLLISISRLPDFLGWLQYVSIYQYVLQSLVVNEIVGAFYNATPTNINGQLVCSPLDGCLNGTALLEINGYIIDPDWIWISTGALIAIIISQWVLTYCLLCCVKKHK
ncbi:broad substrate specificity ATP-binding cassette transporter ABCG2-like [Halichondria panicea]|uniref:broad substrate specificity ATP-binding cassette transporter ABCG2-like n=1 Tax=Halichondria panicea TaxID=6063 RepID=UPI00312B91D6